MLLDSFLPRYCGALHGLLTSIFPNYYLLAMGYCPLSLGFCLVHRTVASRLENHGMLQNYFLQLLKNALPRFRAAAASFYANRGSVANGGGSVVLCSEYASVDIQNLAGNETGKNRIVLINPPQPPQQQVPIL
jgi:hypothetical protein